jgi:hypothetical protein
LNLLNPDPAFQVDSDLDPGTRFLSFIVTSSVADPDLFNRDPDPAFQVGSDRRFDDQKLEKKTQLKKSLF